MLNKNFLSTFVNNDYDELNAIVSRFKDVNDVPGVMYVNENNNNIRIVRGKNNENNCVALIKHTNNKYGHLNDVEVCWSSKSQEGETYELNTVYGGPKKYSLAYIFSHMYNMYQPGDEYVTVQGGKIVRNNVLDFEISSDGVLYDCDGKPKKDCINAKNYEHDSKRYRRVITKAVFFNDRCEYFVGYTKIFVHKICGATIMNLTLNDFDDFRGKYCLDIDHIDSDSGSSSRSNRFTNLQLVTKLANQELKICRGNFKITRMIDIN